MIGLGTGGGGFSGSSAASSGASGGKNTITFGDITSGGALNMTTMLIIGAVIIAVMFLRK